MNRHSATNQARNSPAHGSEAYERVAAGVMARIARKRQAQARASAAFHIALLVLAAIAIGPAVGYALSSAASSGFSAYISLIATDGASLAAYWKEFAFTVLESAPIMAGAVVLAIALVAAYAVRETAGDIALMRRFGSADSRRLTAAALQ